MPAHLRRATILLLMTLLLALVAGCAYHPGGDALAFLRDGVLYTIQADGANLHQIAGDSIVSFSWSPSRQQLVYRTASPFPSNRGQSPLENTPDLSGDLSVVSVNGGSALPITPDASSLVRSDAWWNADGNRLLYAERFPTTDGLDSATEYVVSQADQPVGIASKSVPDAATLPALSADGAQVARINTQGELLLGAPGTSGKSVASGVLRQLPDTSRVGRVLWRPRTNDLLYAAVAENNAVQLTLRKENGATRALKTVTGMLDACFSPDGSWLLVRTTERFTVWDVHSLGSARYEWASSDQTAIPYWSPDSKRLLVFDAAGASLVDLEKKTAPRVLSYAQPYQARQGMPHWRPAPGSPWSPDGASIVFMAAVGDSWSGAKLTTAGLYVASIRASGAGNARLIDSGVDEAPLWSYLDPSASFLLPS
jgi:Tol biopolymer transport system component